MESFKIPRGMCGVRRIRPCVAVGTLAHRASLRIEGAELPIAAFSQLARPGGGEVVSRWCRFVGTVFYWTPVLGHHEPWDVSLAKIGVGTRSVGAVALGVSMREVVATRL